MRQISFILAIVLVVGVFSWSACQNGHEPRMGAMHQRALSDSLERGYQQLQTRYQRMGDSLSPSMRQMAGSMQQMHRQMMGADSMGGRGMRRGMNGQGMQEGGMMRHHQQMHGGVQREWHQQMRAMHRQMAQMHRGQHPGMAARHRKMAQWHQQVFNAVPPDTSTSSPAAERSVAGGEAIYQQQCAACHGANGQGIPGTFPPLSGSEWVTGDEEVLAKILLHGLQGSIEVDGRRYNGVMPAFGGRLSNTEIAATLTYIRSSWGNAASDVTEAEVKDIRSEYRNRRRPWTAQTLRNER